MHKVLLTEPIHREAWEFLARHVQILDHVEDLPLANAILTRNLRIDAATLESAPQLKVIGIHGSGTDGVDLEAAQQRNIEVFHTPYLNTRSVAELNVAFILELSRKIHCARRHLGENAPIALQGAELQGKIVGFLGTGHIACKTAQILCEGFGMEAIGYSPSYTPKKAEEGWISYAADRQSVLRQSDYVCICMPYNAQTKGLIGETELEQMKRSAYLINCARGGIVDEAALYHALRIGRIAGAACDVFCKEPLQQEEPLLQLENFIATPHIGANTQEALYRVGMETVKGIVQRLNGEKSCAGQTIVFGRDKQDL